VKADTIRERFLKFFEHKGHKVVYSDSLVPSDDPTLLFTGAGMNQFKDYFLGIKKDLKRAASSQKCFRTGDIDNVGKTPSHHTFFEMLGNFSFGDYFKKEAIQWAWEFMTRQLGIPEKRMWVSVYQDDVEAYDIWLNLVKLPKDKIKKLGDKENFWPSEAKTKGPNGPCGPCSEIYVDQVEVWNLVFTQFDRKEGGALEPLPTRNIDTGMGLERITAVMQGVHSNFETDLFVPIIRAIKDECPPAYQKDLQSIYTIADHIRAASFLITDGVLPSNESRGYVQRMVIRRAARCGKQLGIEKPFLYKLVPSVAAVMKKQYPQVEARRENIAQIILKEEERFSQTLQEGLEILDGLMSSNKSRSISGDDAFKLYDTYGFPLDLTEEIAGAKGFKVDKAGFKRAMERQRESSRRSSAIAGDIFAATFSQRIKKLCPQTEFLGYDKLSAEGQVVAILRNEESVRQALEGEEVGVVLDRTPFYGESGGQIGDTGRITGRQQAALKVKDTKVFDKVTVHIGKVEKGVLGVGDKVTAEVDRQRRQDIARNHTATHLLQAALRKVLGEHVHQSGSLVTADRLRFDFTHFKALTQQQIERVEQIVNDNIKRSDKVLTRAMDLKKAVESGAMALFNERYEDDVRVVSIGDYSSELCGGTHLDDISKIGAFKIISESSISAGARRIEAVTGGFVREAVEKENAKQRAAVKKEEQENLKAQMDKVRRKALLENTDNIIKNSKSIKGIKVIAAEIPQAGIDDLRSLCDNIRSKQPSVAILLASTTQGKVSLVLALSKVLVEKGYDAVKIIKDVSRITGGSGGGRADMAQAGGTDPSRLKDAFKRFEELIGGA
jgi:alanyl-tRNA synthetase